MKKKILGIVLCVFIITISTGCEMKTKKNQNYLSENQENNEQITDNTSTGNISTGDTLTGNTSTGNISTGDTLTGNTSTGNISIDDTSSTDLFNNVESDTINEIETTEKTQTIQDELDQVELKSIEFNNSDWDNMPQQEMNQTTAQWYKLWDDELNSLWERLNNELDDDAKSELIEEQREWVKIKEQNVKAAGEEAYGGSLQPQLENSEAEEMTRVRAYILAKYLADVKNEEFTIPSDVMITYE